MTFDEWWKEHSRIFRERYVMMGPMGMRKSSKAAWNAGMREGKTCASCGKPIGSVCPQCQRLWES
jgi:hypothetical protein